MLFKKKTLDILKDELMTAMLLVEPDSREYGDMLQKLVLLSKLNKNKNKKSFDWVPLLGIVANFAGILVILNYEKLDSITSKSLGFINKGRV